MSKNVLESMNYDRLATNDVSLTPSLAIFDAKKGFAGRAIMRAVLKIQKNVEIDVK